MHNAGYGGSRCALVTSYLCTSIHRIPQCQNCALSDLHRNTWESLELCTVCTYCAQSRRGTKETCVAFITLRVFCVLQRCVHMAMRSKAPPHQQIDFGIRVLSHIEPLLLLEEKSRILNELMLTLCHSRHLQSLLKKITGKKHGAGSVDVPRAGTCSTRIGHWLFWWRLQIARAHVFN